METEKYKAELEQAIYEGVDGKFFIGEKTVEKVLKEAVTEALRIHDVIESASFQKAIKDAIEYGKGTDYGYNGEDEFCFDTFNSDLSMQEVIKVLKEHFI